VVLAYEANTKMFNYLNPLSRMKKLGKLKYVFAIEGVLLLVMILRALF
jgi:hypothetical protein